MDKVWQNSNTFEEFIAKIKTYNKPQDIFDLLVIKCNKEIWQKRMNAQDRNKDLKVKNFYGAVLKGAFTICKVKKNLINLKDDQKISG